jgi:hypothetical protein
MDCLVCGAKLKVGLCHGKKGRGAIMLSCPNDGRHFRAFINEPRVISGMTQENLALEEVVKRCNEINL